MENQHDIRRSFIRYKEKGFHTEYFQLKNLIIFFMPLFLVGHFAWLDYILILFYVIVVIISPIEKAMLIYIALFPWERMFPLPTLSLHSVIQIIIIFKILLKSFVTNGFLISNKNILLMTYLFFYGILSIVIYKNISGIGLAISLVLLVYVNNNIKNEYFAEFWDGIQKSSIFSVLIACIYGVLFQRVGLRWVDGMGYVPLFRGILESNEMAFYLNVVLLFSLVANIKVKQKVVLFIIFYVFLLMTVSITGVLVSIVIVIYAYFSGLLFIDSKKQIIIKRILSLFFILLIVVIFLQLDISRPVIMRFDSIVKSLSANNYDKAFSNRSSLANYYIKTFRSFNIYNKLIGVQLYARDFLLSQGINKPFSHNSFIEFLFYTGIIGEILLFSYIAIKIISLRDTKYFHEFVLLKLIVIISGASVSMLGYNFWPFWLLL